MKKNHSNYKHNLIQHPLYRVWSSIIQRCENPNDKDYGNYGGRGIYICKDWRRSFIEFYTWCINNGYQKGLEIDRRNNNLGYCPENCRFVTHLENGQNQRKCLAIYAFGKTQSLSAWSRESGIPLGTLYSRYRDGIIGDELFKPRKRQKR